jgi:amidase
MLRATGMTHTAWLALNERRSQMRRAWSTFFRDWDVLLCPAAPVPAFPHQQDEPLPSRHLIVDGESRPYSDMLFWAGPAGVSHLPATVAPLGLSASGLPIGVQILGPLHGDLTTITVGAMLEEAWRGFHPPPFG